MNSIPNGTIAFLFTDIEGSTRLWENEPEGMKAALELHDTLLRSSFESRGAYVFKTMGDAFHAAFSRTQDAVEAALAAQLELEKQAWRLSRPIKVRMAIHAGAADVRDGDYYGQSLNRAARILSVAHGGQTLISLAALELARDQLPETSEVLDLGEHRLKDLIRPEHLFQIHYKNQKHDFPPLRSLDTTPHNLPIQATSFIGRRSEVETLISLLFPKDGGQKSRLVTLLSAGGAGKTRLALQTVAELIDRFPDGVWFVDLAPLREAAAAEAATARVLGIEEKEGVATLTRITEGLKHRKIMVILDNCEHLIEAAARLAQALLAANKELCVLATSREHLRIPAETLFPVPPLSTPEHDALASPEELSQFESVKLFIERARSVSPHFLVDADSAPAIADICFHLDGMPLAIELAAAKTRILSANDIRGRLKDRFKLLTGGSRTALPRQQTMRALIDWSYDLLDQEERAFFRQLAVFRGSFTLEAAEFICAGDYDVIDLLDKLCMKSIVFRFGDNRYRLLETIREYALSLTLEPNPGLDLAHFTYYSALASKDANIEYGQILWTRLGIIASEHENYVQALEWALKHKPWDGLKMALDLSSYWASRGFSLEGTGWIEAFLLAYELEKQTIAGTTRTDAAHDSLPDHEKILLGRAILALAYLQHQKGRPLDSQKNCNKALKLFKDQGFDSGLAACHRVLGLSHHAHSFFVDSLAEKEAMRDLSRREFEISLSLYTQLNHPWGIAEAIAGLSMLTATEHNSYQEAIEMMSESLDIRQSIGDLSGVGWSHVTIGECHDNLGDGLKSLSHFEEARANFVKAGDRWGQSYLYEQLGFAYIMEQRLDEAEALLIECEQLRRRISDHVFIDLVQVFRGFIRMEREQYAEAEYFIEEAMHKAEKAGDMFTHVYALGMYSYLYTRTQQFDKLQAILSALKTRNNHIMGGVVEVYLLLGEITLAINQQAFAEALEKMAQLQLQAAQHLRPAFSLAKRRYKELLGKLSEHINVDHLKVEGLSEIKGEAARR